MTDCIRYFFRGSINPIYFLSDMTDIRIIYALSYSAHIIDVLLMNFLLTVAIPFNFKFTLKIIFMFTQIKL